MTVVEPRAADHFKQPLLHTPFHERTSAMVESHDWGRWAGYAVPNTYRDLELEYTAIRNTASVFDLTPMVKYRIAGPDAERFLDRLTVRDVSKLRPGRVQYTVWCDDDGKVMDDGTLFRLDSETFRLCCQEHQYAWLRAAAVGFDVEIDEITDEVAGLALQGPTSFAVLEAAGLGEARGLRPFDMAHYRLDGVGRVTVSRTGFTGDLGYELWVGNDSALALWDALFEAGRLHGLKPIGSAALDIARIEAGFVMTNADFIAAEQAVRADRVRSPFEVGLGWLVDFDKGHFNGRRALLKEKEHKTSRWCLVGLDIDGNVPAAQSLVYFNRKREVGHITAAVWSPTTKRNLALAVLERPFGVAETDDLWVEIYVQHELRWQRLMERARVVPRPFFDPPRRRATPPDYR